MALRRDFAERSVRAASTRVPYQLPFELTAKLDKLTFALDPPKLTPEDLRKLKEAEAKAADGASAHMQPGPG